MILFLKSTSGTHLPIILGICWVPNWGYRKITLSLQEQTKSWQTMCQDVKSSQHWLWDYQRVLSHHGDCAILSCWPAGQAHLDVDRKQVDVYLSLFHHCPCSTPLFSGSPWVPSSSPFLSLQSAACRTAPQGRSITRPEPGFCSGSQH